MSSRNPTVYIVNYLIWSSVKIKFNCTNLKYNNTVKKQHWKISHIQVFKKTKQINDEIKSFKTSGWPSDIIRNDELNAKTTQ